MMPIKRKKREVTPKEMKWRGDDGQTTKGRRRRKQTDRQHNRSVRIWKIRGIGKRNAEERERERCRRKEKDAEEKKGIHFMKERMTPTLECFSFPSSLAFF